MPAEAEKPKFEAGIFVDTTRQSGGFTFGGPSTTGQSEKSSNAAAADAGLGAGWASAGGGAGTFSVSSGPLKPVLDASGSGSGSGSGGGGGGGEEEYDPEYKAIVDLNLTRTASGEEEEDVLCEVEGKLFRWGMGNAGEQWKMRAKGPIRLLRHRSTGQVRVLLREGTLQKVRLNHFVKGVEIKYREGDKKKLMWTSVDSSDGEPQEGGAGEGEGEGGGVKIHQFLLYLRTEEAAEELKSAWDVHDS